MSLPTFYIPPGRISGDSAILDGDELRHARTTLRLGPGDQAKLIDGTGGSFEARFRTLGKDQALLDILENGMDVGTALIEAQAALEAER